MTSRSHILLLAALAPACAAETVSQPPPPPVYWAALAAPRTDARAAKVLAKERAVATVYFKALASPGFAQLAPLLDELAHFTSGAKETRGRERVVAAHQALLGSFEQRSFVVRRAWLTNDDKALEWTMTGTRAGQPITLNGLTLLWTNDDALISDIHVYFADPTEAPAGERLVLEQAGVPQETANVALMRELVRALQDNKEPAFVALFSDGTGDKERARGHFRALRRSLGQLDTVVENAWGVQDFVIMEYAVSGRQLAPLPRIPLVRDRLLRLGLVDVGEIRDGKITHIWRYDDENAPSGPDRDR